MKLTADDFAQRAHACRGKLYGVAYGYLGNQADALEAVDDAIYHAYLKRGSLREHAHFDTWLVRIVINTCLTMLRKRKWVEVSDSLPEQAHAMLDHLPLHEAVRHLEEPLRAVIILRYFNDFTLEQTATQLQIPVGTVSTRQRRALQLLKLELEEESL